jgi:hypothetical protein
MLIRPVKSIQPNPNKGDLLLYLPFSDGLLVSCPIFFDPIDAMTSGEFPVDGPADFSLF